MKRTVLIFLLGACSAPPSALSTAFRASDSHCYRLELELELAIDAFHRDELVWSADGNWLGIKKDRDFVAIQPAEPTRKLEFSCLAAAPGISGPTFIIQNREGLAILDLEEKSITRLHSRQDLRTGSNGIALSPSGEQLFVSGSLFERSGSQLREVNRQQPVDPWQAIKLANSTWIQWFPDEEQAIVGSVGGHHGQVASIMRVDLMTHEVLAKKDPQDLRGVAFHPILSEQGRSLLCFVFRSYYEDMGARIVSMNPETLEVVAEIGLSDIRGWSYLHENAVLVCNASQESLQILDPITLDTLHEFPVRTGEFMTVSPNRNRVAVEYLDKVSVYRLVLEAPSSE